MTQLVLGITGTVGNTFSGSFKKIRSGICSILPRETLFLGSILVVLQVLDGVLTAIGVLSFGLQAEGKPLIRHLMSLWGPIEALIFVKVLALLVIYVLCRLATQVLWLPQALRAIICVYMFAAVVPWTAILLGQGA